jgi:sulfur carrier protein ThiS
MTMKVVVEFFPQRREIVMDLPARSNGHDLMKSLLLAPDVHILVRDDVPIPIDEELKEGDRVRIIAVVSGG